MHLLLCGKGWGASLLEKIYLKHNKREREPSIPLQELSFYKLWFSNFCIFLTKCGRPYMFQTKNFVSSNNLSLKSGWIDLGIRRFEFVAKTQYLWFFFMNNLFFQEKFWYPACTEFWRENKKIKFYEFGNFDISKWIFLQLWTF